MSNQTGCTRGQRVARAALVDRGGVSPRPCKLNRSRVERDVEVASGEEQAVEASDEADVLARASDRQ